MVPFVVAVGMLASLAECFCSSGSCPTFAGLRLRGLVFQEFNPLPLREVLLSRWSVDGYLYAARGRRVRSAALALVGLGALAVFPTFERYSVRQRLADDSPRHRRRPDARFI